MKVVPGINNVYNGQSSSLNVPYRALIGDPHHHRMMMVTDECEADVSSSKRKILVVAVATALSGVVLAATQAAHAESIPAIPVPPAIPAQDTSGSGGAVIVDAHVTCPDGMFCLYTEDTNPTTQGKGIAFTDGSAQSAFGDYDNQTVWVHNHTDHVWCIADEVNLGGRRFPINPNEDRALNSFDQGGLSLAVSSVSATGC